MFLYLLSLDCMSDLFDRVSISGFGPVMSKSFLYITLTLLRHSGGYSAGVPPLPIPNREVKPGHADGTAHKVGE